MADLPLQPLEPRRLRSAVGIESFDRKMWDRKIGKEDGFIFFSAIFLSTCVLTAIFLSFIFL